MQEETISDPYGEMEISFGYQCNNGQTGIGQTVSDGNEILPGFRLQRTSSFSCLSGAALSANATLANTNIGNGIIGTAILPSLDSPKSFRKVPSSPSLSKLDMISPSLHGSGRGMSSFSCSASTSPSPPDSESYFLKSMSAPSRNEGFLSATEVQVAGGAAGEDRVQAVCSEENGWLFCAIYDGFNGRDAADFLACTLYESIAFYVQLLDRQLKQKLTRTMQDNDEKPYSHTKNNAVSSRLHGLLSNNDAQLSNKIDSSSDFFRQGVLDCLSRALVQAENDFLRMVEQEMEDRPDLVSVGSCVLIALLVGEDLYILNLGDSRAVLATYRGNEGNERLKAVQLTEDHSVDNETEKARVLCEHPDDPKTIFSGKVKGKLKVTRALGVGYLKKEKLNDALMGILRVRNLVSPPYVSVEPSTRVHRISKSDHFVIVASDGLFDFFSNEEAVRLVHSFISSNSAGDPAKYLLEHLVARAATRAGFTMEELMNVPAGRRRRYHDDVTVMVIILGSNQRTSKASTFI
ncbi:PREDICTED: probable protein phosphatase 2C 40 [Tarenaya hassleriana]|uniref:probable protein phosphatase 2C 40 n=1 Tax=Tarenaya hassleriana TaxID=28532 RepID=UPI00053C52AA|nr:PREDICTED: probable protein phosphatase 2C 40 [Tarenaya hassleriana]XP_010548943.1 PREDICTED: probable protein phosphatase 2C 40 [Tarenaya hassleriana]